MSKRVILFILLSFIANSVYPQSEDSRIAIGMLCPNIRLTEVYDYNDSTLSVEDFRGKWIVLDFWNSGCKSCVESFSKTNKILPEFRDRLEVILIGQDDPFIRTLYDKMKNHYQLNLIHAYDSALFEQLNILSVPHLIWVDKNGIVRQITDHTQFNSTNISAVLADNNLLLPQKNGSEGELTPIDGRKPITGVGDESDASRVLYRSLLTGWSPGMRQFIPDFSERNNWSKYMSNGIQLIGVNLRMLYCIAYSGVARISPWHDTYGKIYPGLIFENSDTTAFNFDYDVGKGIYNYSLIVPLKAATNSNLQQALQDDLSRAFGYAVSLEERKMPYWSLRVKRRYVNRLLTKGSEPYTPEYGSESSGFTIRNQPVNYVVSTIYMHHQNEPPIIDETKIEGNIDLELDAILMDLSAVRQALNKSGLDLVKKRKKMKVMVIREPRQY